MKNAKESIYDMEAWEVREHFYGRRRVSTPWDRSSGVFNCQQLKAHI